MGGELRAPAMTSSPAPAVSALPVTLEHATDTAGLEGLLEEGRLVPDEVCAITGKTEGRGPDDRSRDQATKAVRQFLLRHGRRPAAAVSRVPVVLSSGGVGIMAPHLVVFSRRRATTEVSGQPRLVLGSALSEPIRPEWVGRRPMVEAVADSVVRAAAEAGVDPRDARYVLTKSRALYPEDVAEAARRGTGLALYPDELTVPKASGAAALGVARALGLADIPTDDRIGVDPAVWTPVASCSSGRESPRTGVLLFGNSTRAAGTLRVGTAVMRDLLDIGALRRALADAGLDVPDSHRLPAVIRARIVAVYVKIGRPAGGRLRGRRQVQGQDNPYYVGELKAAVSGMFVAELQDTLLYISGTAIHQGPEGGGTVAMIVDHDARLG